MKKEMKQAIEKVHEFENEAEPVKDIKKMQKETLKEIQKLGKLLKPLKLIDEKKARKLKSK